MKNGKKNSIKIGTFTQDKKGVIEGKIFGLGLGVIPVTGEPQTSQGGLNYIRLMAGSAKDAYEIGVAFPKEKDGLRYHSVSIESPMLPAPINAALFPDRDNTGGLNLLWNRADIEHAPKAEATVNVNYPQPQGQTHTPAPVQASTRRSTNTQPRM